MEVDDRGTLVSFYRSDTGGMVGLMPAVSTQAAANPPYITMAQTGIASLSVSIGGTTYDCPVDGMVCVLPRLPPPASATKASLKIVIKSLTTEKGGTVAINDNEYSAEYSSPSAGVEDTTVWPWPFRWDAGLADCNRSQFGAGLPSVCKVGPSIGWFSAGGVWYALPAAATEKTESSSLSWAESGGTIVGAQSAAQVTMEFTTVTVPADYAARLSTIADCSYVYINKVAYIPKSLSVSAVGTEYAATVSVEWPL